VLPFIKDNTTRFRIDATQACYIYELQHSYICSEGNDSATLSMSDALNSLTYCKFFAAVQYDFLVSTPVDVFQFSCFS
jgi:hypothetical protein